MARVFVGTYTKTGSKGVYVAEFDAATGKLELTGETCLVPNPTFLALHPSGQYLYSVCETADHEGHKSGGVSAFAVDPASGALTLLNQQLSQGTSPCHLCVDAEGKCVLVANYSSGSVAALPIQADGTLAEASCAIQHEGSGPDPKRQQGPHAHSINLDPTGKFAMACDLGLDQILMYDFAADEGTLTPHTPPHKKTHAGAGPRHFCFGPTGRFAYCIDELDSTLIAMMYDGLSGWLCIIDSYPTIPEDAGEVVNWCADVHAHPSGKWVYGSNRGHHSLVTFQVNQDTGRLTSLGTVPSGGDWPRNFAIDPSGQWLLAANERSDNIVTFRINQETGIPEPTGSAVAVPAPVCVLFAG